MNKPAAIYARVSSDRQKENHTIASQTAALIEYAQTHGYSVPPEWIFQDEGYSGAILVRPGLEALRDLAAEGQIAAALIYSPDRLSRKYAYQVLLSEELSRCGVQLIFLKSPVGATPEDQLLVQFQGMIAEYERAQIAERSRRGKRHMAQRGGVNVLSGAPYGYRYVKKSNSSAAFYEIIEVEAQVVRMIFEMYTQQGLSINAIARLLNERHIPTRSGKSRWERSTVWGILRNPAYRGTACYGKTELRPRQRITRPLRQRKGLASRDSANHERPRAEWIQIPVPALVSEEMFALAQEQLEKNKKHAPRRTTEPTLLQGMLVCEQCGYALYRCSTRTSKQLLHYYRCLGSDGYRRLRGPVCTNRPIRQDYLDQFVWDEIIRLLEDPALIQSEIDRRRTIARNTDPFHQRQQELRREQMRIEKNSERLLTAYQEGLVTLPQLRQRMPALQKQAQAIGAELQSLEMAAVDEARYLQLAESLAGFRSKLRSRADTLDIAARQQILRLVVKEILVGTDTIILRHSIPIPQSGPGSSGPSNPPADVTGLKPVPDCLLRSRSHYPALRSPALAGKESSLTIASCLEHRPYQTQHSTIRYSLGHQREEFLMIHGSKKVFEIRIYDPLSSALNLLPNFAHGILRRSPSLVSEIGLIEHRLEDRLQPVEQRLLAYPVINSRDSQRAKLARLASLRDLHLPHRLRSVVILLQFMLQSIQLLLELCSESFQTLPIRRVTSDRVLEFHNRLSGPFGCRRFWIRHRRTGSLLIQLATLFPAAVTMLAAYVPARRSTRVDPAEALREE